MAEEDRNLGNYTDRELLVRIDERTKNMGLAIGLVTRDLEVFRVHVSDNYLKRVEFKVAFLPVRNIVYGFVALILISFIGAIISLVLTAKGSTTPTGSSSDRPAQITPDGELP